ncbi:MAG: hypothetical protein KAU48_05800 [Candidatus Thorarchaeota archaeon]|nr:hypothetical protein [Candidatus Thorarchaeota archaeon]
MVIPLVLMYIFGVALLATFLVTKRYLNSQSGSISSKEKYVHGVNFMSFSWTFTCIFMVSFMEFLIIRTPTSLWPSVIEFFNESLSLFSLYTLIMLSILSVTMFVAGYKIEKRESYFPVNAIGKKWLVFFIILYIVVGIVGGITGILL